ncbi:ABC transporter permease subunit [Haloarchaeobius iranensis]|uniref:ABC-type dipeptide/oligopeptide/nickel transport system, permease component n=1 Tax=Haloarchaeobius iranensis TaxID=996166 RepID=A0A1G9S9T8_9EURY|nr:ABC transporter permease [Haloarchaeobius iranensis]SDM32224.1 ABC-type dipeptide/oligopeptide/nickel transport system, permease component [Haloarchaeobius iranensis]
MHRDALHPTGPWRYLAARIAVAALGLLTAVSICFAAFRLGPLSTAQAIVGPVDLGPVRRQRYHRLLGVDDDPVEAFLTYVDGPLTFDLGKAWVLDRGPAGPLLADALPNTALVAVGAFCLVTVVAVPVGLAAGLRDGRLGAAVEYGSVLGRSSSNLVPAVLAVALLWPGGEPARPPVLVLTTVVVASTLVGTRIRAVSRAVREARHDGHVDAARAKGISRSAVFWRHLAPVALLTHLRRVADDAAYLVGAVVVVEAVLPRATPPVGEAYGLGRLFFQASIQGDFPLAATLVVLFTAAVLAVRLLGDLVLALVDPRVGPRAGRR